MTALSQTALRLTTLLGLKLIVCDRLHERCGTSEPVHMGGRFAFGPDRIQARINETPHCTTNTVASGQGSFLRIRYTYVMKCCEAMTVGTARRAATAMRARECLLFLAMSKVG